MKQNFNLNVPHRYALHYSEAVPVTSSQLSVFLIVHWELATGTWQLRMTDKRLILSTVSNADEARTIARALVEKQLAACVNIVGPIESIYRWKGEIEEAQEFLLLIKTIADNVSRLREELVRLHSYEVPECISLGIESGLPAYLDWISESVK